MAKTMWYIKIKVFETDCENEWDSYIEFSSIIIEIPIIPVITSEILIHLKIKHLFNLAQSFRTVNESSSVISLELMNLEYQPDPPSYGVIREYIDNNPHISGLSFYNLLTIRFTIYPISDLLTICFIRNIFQNFAFKIIDK